MIFLVTFIKLSNLNNVMVLLDELDIFIIRQFFQKGITTTWSISNSYNWEDKPKDPTKIQKNTFYSAKTNLIEYRIKRLSKDGLIKIEKNDEKIFVLDTNRVIIKKVRNIGGIKINSECLFIKDINNKWCAFQL